MPGVFLRYTTPPIQVTLGSALIVVSLGGMVLSAGPAIVQISAGNTFPVLAAEFKQLDHLKMKKPHNINDA